MSWRYEERGMLRAQAEEACKLVRQLGLVPRMRACGLSGRYSVQVYRAARGERAPEPVAHIYEGPISVARVHAMLEGRGQPAMVYGYAARREGV